MAGLQENAVKEQENVYSTRGGEAGYDTYDRIMALVCEQQGLQCLAIASWHDTNPDTPNAPDSASVLDIHAAMSCSPRTCT